MLKLFYGYRVEDYLWQLRFLHRRYKAFGDKGTKQQIKSTQINLLNLRRERSKCVTA